MKTALIVACDNAYGLSEDIKLFTVAFEEIGFSVSFTSPNRSLWDRLFSKKRYDIILHIERVAPGWCRAGRKNLLAPHQERYPRRQIGRLKHIDMVLAKTRHAEDIFSALGIKTTRTGFTSPDKFIPSIEKNWRGFIHLAGGSTLKGTTDILAVWEKHPEWPELILVQKAKHAPKTIPRNVTLHAGYLTEETLGALRNSSGIHLCPSQSEGWGHYIMEAMACGAVVVTTDAPPMNELVSPETGFLVNYNRTEPRHLGTNYFVDQAALERTIETILTTPTTVLAEMGQRARADFERRRPAFTRHLKDILDNLIPKGGD